MKIGDLFSVEGRAAVVTGGASGIGYAIAGALAENGARVTIFDIDAGKAEAAASRLSLGGVEVSWTAVDVTDDGALRQAFGEAARAGAIDVVYANAGISGGPGFLTFDRERNPGAAIEDIAPAFFDRVVATNLGSVFKTVQAAVPHLKAAGGGRIVVTSSISATRAETLVGAPYVASKAGVAQLVRQFALELARYAITVNAIAPGPVATDIAGGRLQSAETQARFAEHCPMHRIGACDDIVGAALFLASPAARFITGAEIVIDGGVTLGVAD
jgi:NAD(P)-dependent dehydrogenase (short-subunit alcohol dehydrogenase family)